MEELNRYQKAALVSSTKRRQKSLQEYYKNPNICKYCNKPIIVNGKQKVVEVRKKIFCNHSCSAIFNNQQRDIKTDLKKNKVLKSARGKFEFISGLTKKDLINKHGVYYKYRSVIRKHAHFIFNNHYEFQKCKVCGYDTHVEVCHIKSVSSFCDDTLITEINSIDNLIGLCPNHHWEFDNGLIKHEW